MRNRKRTAAPTVLLIMLLTLPALYLGLYYAALDNHVMSPVISFGGPNRDRAILGPPSYRFGGEYSARLFYPAHLIDKHLVRRDLWVDFLDSQPVGGLW